MRGKTWRAEAKRGEDYEEATGPTLDDALAGLAQLVRLELLRYVPLLEQVAASFSINDRGGRLQLDFTGRNPTYPSESMREITSWELDDGAPPP